MRLAPSDIEALSTSLSRWEMTEYIFEGLVVVACMGELVADLANRITDRRKKRLERWSTMLLVAALSMELICLVRTNSLSGLLIGSLGEKASIADSKAQSALNKSTLAESRASNASSVAGDALADSKEAKDAAGEAQEKIEALGKRAEDIDADLAQTQWLISARSVQNRDELSEKLRQQFKGRDVILKSYTGDQEGSGLCTQLWYVTHSAEMKPVDECGRAALTVPLVSPLSISGPDIDETSQIADSLVKVGRVPFGTVSGFRSPTLTIFVGVKPPFSVGQARPLSLPTKKQTKKRPPNNRFPAEAKR